VQARVLRILDEFTDGRTVIKTGLPGKLHGLRRSYRLPALAGDSVQRASGSLCNESENR